MWRRCALYTALFFAGMTVAHGQTSCPWPFLRGSFLQPWLGDAWTEEQWHREFSYMKRACVDQMVLQWTADSKAKTTVFPTSLPGYTQSTVHDVVERALAAADEKGAQVYLGLQINADWWVNYANDATWLQHQAETANDLADDLWSRYNRHPSLSGWYLAFEVDNQNEPTLATWERLVRFYQTVGGHLHNLTPGKPVLIAPYFMSSVGLTSAQWQTMWEYILKRSPIDVLALQDGIGAGNAQKSDLRVWFGAVRAAIRNANPEVEFWADTETFTSSGGFHPMGIGSVVQDMRLVQDDVSNYLSFSFNHYISPQQVDPAYYRTYLNYLATSTVEGTPPSVPTNVSASATNSISIRLAWTASTDEIGVVGYMVYRNGSLAATLYSRETRYLDTQLNPDSNYAYRISAFDAAGNQSGRSQPVSTRTPPDPYKVDLALHKPYVASLPADPSYPDSGGVELTDGILGSLSYTDPAWQGRNTASAYSFTIDLGAVQAIKEIRSQWLQYESVGIYLPQTIAYSVSADDENFVTVGVVNQPVTGTTNLKQWFTATGLSRVTGRYVRIEVTPASEVWTFVDEAEVRR